MVVAVTPPHPRPRRARRPPPRGPRSCRRRVRVGPAQGNALKPFDRGRFGAPPTNGGRFGPPGR